MPPSGETRLCHLELIQAVISRLASSSSSMKALAGTIIAASVALFGTIEGPNWAYLVGIMLPTTVFWALDAHYLRIECAYRLLYDAVRKDQHTDELGMDYKPYLKSIPSFLAKMFTWSVAPFYIALLVSVVLIFLLSAAGAPDPNNVNGT